MYRAIDDNSCGGSSAKYDVDYFDVIIADVNVPPTWDTKIPDQSLCILGEDTVLNAHSVSDANGDTVAVTMDPYLNTDHYEFNDVTLDILFKLSEWVEAEAGDYTYTMIATDDDTTTGGLNILSASYSFTISAVFCNQAPDWITVLFEQEEHIVEVGEFASFIFSTTIIEVNPRDSHSVACEITNLYSFMEVSADYLSFDFDGT
jgi:hypothetical protein